MNYRKLPPAQSARIIVDREFPTIQIDNVLINSIRGEWEARRGYFVRFKMLIETPLGKLNLTSCVLEAGPGGRLVWRTPKVYSGHRTAEVDLSFYNAVLEAFEAQSWINFVGSSRLSSTALELPPNDPLATALKAASEAL